MPSVAAAIARFIVSQHVERVYSLPGSHVKPIWSELARTGVRVVSARSECAAVHMAHADAALTARAGVALVTAGPGLTNAITGIASAHAARMPLLVISARVPDAQSGMGALEEVPQADLVHPVCRYVREVSHPRHVLPSLHFAVNAALGSDGPPGPAYVDFDPVLLKDVMADWHLAEMWFKPIARNARMPDPAAIESAAALLRAATRPIVIGGRGLLAASSSLERFLLSTGCLYLDTRESRGALPLDSTYAVPAVRGRAIAEADLVVTLGRRLDFELGYGSSAVFAETARFIRIGRSSDELCENRPGNVEILADLDQALDALVRADVRPSAADTTWRDDLLAANTANARRLADTMAASVVEGDDRVHPYALIAAVNAMADKEAICIVDGGDILSFARVALRAHTYLDLGAFGCLGSGVPYAVAAALAFPRRRVIALVGDGAFGFAAMEIETAVRNGARALFIVANNDAWNIERHDQLARYPGQDLGTTLSPCRYDRLAQSLGAHGERVVRPDELAPALERALQKLPAVVDVAITRGAISPDFKSGLADIPPLHAVLRWNDAEERKLQPGQ
jgi:acetolactate synthase-1/2/3 large subunit